MSTEQICGLLETASNQYNDGEYEESIATWGRVIELNPENQIANEGIRMARLLAGQQSRQASSATATDLERQVRDRIKSGIARIHELAANGEFESALEGCTLLEGIAPQNAQVQEVGATIRETVAAARAMNPGSDCDPVFAPSADTFPHATEDSPDPQEIRGIPEVAPVDTMDLDSGNPESAAIDEPICLDDMIEPLAEEAARPESDRVAALLHDGRQAFDRGQMLEAIAVWSRVYAIDQSHAGVTELIDAAKEKLKEDERRLEDLFNRGLEAFDAGDLDEALSLFTQLRDKSPTHAEALVYIEQINARLAGDAETIGLNTEAAEEVEMERKGSMDHEPDPMEQLIVPLVLDDQEEIRHTPERNTMEDSPRGTVLGASAANSGSGGKRLLLVAAGVTLVATVAAGAYFWFSDSGTMARAEATVLGGPHAPNPSSGTALESILSPASANSIVSGAASPATKPTPVVSMAETRQEARRYARAGEDHSRRKEWAAAAVALQKAYQLDPLLNVEDALAKAITHLEEAAKLEKEMAEATQLFEEGDYASSLHKLYRLQQEFKGERPFEIYIKNAWFDWGVVLMNSGAIDEAAEKFEEVLEIDSKDQDASRARAVALKYLRRPRDRSFDRFASALPTRTMNGR